MRYSCAALVLLLSLAATAAAQEQNRSRVSADDVVGRLMQFDRNNDLKIAIDELPERMQTLVVRGDKSDDLLLDRSEIRRMTAIGPEMPVLFRSPQFGGYGFGDAFGLFSRVHIENSIEDLRLAPEAAEEAKRLALAQVEDFERTARPDAGKQLNDERRAVLIARLSSVLTEEERGNLNAALARRPLVRQTGLSQSLDLLKRDVQANGPTSSPAVR